MYEHVRPRDTERQLRATLLLESLLHTFIELNGAMRSSQLPHLVALEGAITTSAGVIPAPLVSPLIGGSDDKQTYRTQLETIVNALAPRLAGRHICTAEFFSDIVLRHCVAPNGADLVGQSIRSVERRGKFIVIQLDRLVLAIHLGMTGKFLFDSGRTPYTRAVFGLDDVTLFYEDIRQFGVQE